MNESILRAGIAQIKQMVKDRYTNRDKGLRPLCILGHRGVGKTDIIRQVGQELGIETRITSLQFLEAPELLGLPFREGDKVHYAEPAFFPSSGSGIWYLDEFNRCNRDIRAALLPLLQDRMVNGRKIGDGWIVVLAGNPPASESEIAYEVQEFDTALDDRLAKVFISPTVSEIVDYLEGRYGQNAATTWIKRNPKFLDLEGKTRTSPRGLEYLIKAVNSNGLTLETCASELDAASATHFFKFAQEYKADAVTSSLFTQIAENNLKDYKAAVKDSDTTRLSDLYTTIHDELAKGSVTAAIVLARAFEIAPTSYFESVFDACMGIISENPEMCRAFNKSLSKKAEKRIQEFTEGTSK